jgi:acetolactate decarboxylase
MKRWVLCLLVLFALCGTGHAGPKDVLTQVSTIDALMTGVYDGETTLASLREKGDFGLGTFNNLDGEMVLLDGRWYRVTSTGAVEHPGPETKTPFAAVIFFKADRKIPLERGIDFQEFVTRTDKLLPTQNIFYAIKITGTFEVVKARSVPRQKKPYRPMDDVVKNQSLFHLPKVEGTIVGFRCPPYAKAINVPGYHLHFISQDGKSGGHVLDFKIEKAVMEVDETREFHLVLPADEAFSHANLSPDRGKTLHGIER